MIKKTDNITRKFRAFCYGIIAVGVSALIAETLIPSKPIKN